MKPTDVKFSSKSMVDDFGRVFFHNDKVYRAIYPDSEEYCLNLMKSDLFKKLSDKGYVPKTKTAEIDVDGYALILEHEKLVEIQQHEWSFEMFRKAALMVLETNEICNEYGCQTFIAYLRF